MAQFSRGGIKDQGKNGGKIVKRTVDPFRQKEGPVSGENERFFPFGKCRFGVNSEGWSREKQKET
jgi:hypothetical protein